jgi:hypothetical protein
VSNLEFDFESATPERKREQLVRLVPGREKYRLSFGPVSIDIHLVLPLKDTGRHDTSGGLSVDVEVVLPHAS